MAKTINLIRIANAKLIAKNINFYGKRWAIQDNADGYNIVDVTVEQAPSDIKQYLEGDNSITVYPVPSNVDKLCEYALASFPNIEDLYLFKTSAIVVLEDDLSYLLDLNKIYVPTDLLSAYISAYPTLSSKFDIIVEDYTLTIPFIGNTTLTSEYVDSVIAMLSNAEKNAITKVVIPTDFSSESADSIAWGYNFSAIVNLDNNIWYGATQYDFSVWTINGSGALTSAIVESSISSIPSGKVSAVTKVVIPNTFTLNTSASALCLDPIDTYLPNVNTLELTSIPTQYQGSYSIYSNWNTNDCKFKTMIYNGSSIGFNGLREWKINRLYGNNVTSAGAASLISITFYEIKLPLLEVFQTSIFQSSSFSNCEYILFENAKRFDTLAMNGSSFNGKSLYLPKITTLATMSINTHNYKLFIGTDNCSLGGLLGTNINERPTYIYLKSNKLVDYKIATNWNNYSPYMVGIIDGNNVYTDKGFSYPKLTGIDTETNIQALTPSDNALYLASDTGNLWQYSNGAWTNLFSGYTPTWYSDEDVTTTISPSAMDTSHTYYVKLTAI